jgi:photosystem II stability/assembly factor-like uncharacterized protein
MSSRLLLGILLVAIVGLGGSADAAVPRSSVTAGFQPISFTAVSERDFWLLGTVPCRARGCTAIVRTTNGGRSFSSVPAPAVPTSGRFPELRFADRLDGFAFVRWSGLFFTTHDGGATWRRLRLGRILGFATPAGRAFVVTSRRLEYSRASANAWRSNDAGRTFVTGQGPCVPGLGGELGPVSDQVVWAVCPTGMLAGAWRSTNGGVSFDRLRTPPLVNSAQLAPASATTAVLDRGVAARLLRTNDGGKTWKSPKTPGRATDVVWVGFTDARVGVALLQTGYDVSAKTEITALWRTTDGGASWSIVRIR